MLRRFGVEFGLLSVIERGEDVRPVYEFLLNQDPSIIRFSLRRVNGRSKSHIPDDELVAIAEEHHQVFQQSLRQHAAGYRTPRLADVCNMIENIVTYVPAYMCMRNPCGACLDQVVFDYEGSVWPCQDLLGDERFRVTSGPVRDLNLALTTNETVAALRARSVLDLEDCAKCKWLHFCEGGCFATTYVAENRRFDRALRKRTPHCAYYMYMFRRLIWDVYYARDDVPVVRVPQ